jgi:serine/threonine protein kinase
VQEAPEVISGDNYDTKVVRPPSSVFAFGARRHTAQGSPSFLCPDTSAQTVVWWGSPQDIWSLGILAREMAEGDAPYFELPQVTVRTAPSLFSVLTGWLRD